MGILGEICHLKVPWNFCNGVILPQLYKFRFVVHDGWESST